MTYLLQETNATVPHGNLELEQRDGRTAALPDGGYVIIWTERDPYGGADGGPATIYSRVYGADGKPEGRAHLVAETSTSQADPEIAVRADGSWVVTWADIDGGAYDIKQRVYDADGHAGKIRTVDTGSDTVYMSVPAVTSLANGGHVIAWQEGSGGDPSIHYRTYGSDGKATGKEHTLVTAGLLAASRPQLADLDNGGFVLVFDGVDDSDYRTKQVHAQVFRDGGTAVGDMIDVALPYDVVGYTGNSFSDVAALKGGGFVVAVYGSSFYGPGGYTQGQTMLGAFENDGAAILGTTAFPSSGSSGGGRYPTVTGLADGGWLVAWTRAVGSGDPNQTTLEVDALRYSAKGALVGAVSVLPETGGGLATDPELTALDDWKLVLSWKATTRAQDNVGDVKQELFTVGQLGSAKADDMVGTEKGDLIYGLGGKDTIKGLEGNDILFGNNGRDRLLGAKGRDTLDGGNGNDVLTGGAGKDVFVFGAGHDRIRDFEDDVDSLHLDKALAGGLTMKALGHIVEETAQGLVFDFGGGDVLTVQGIATWADLKDDVILV